jgi:hypothetical protein
VTSTIASRVCRVALGATIAVPILLGASAAHAAAGPLAGLHATVTLDKDLYHVGDTANVAIALSNSGTVSFSGITAECDRIGDPNQLIASGPTWGALASQGVAIPAGQTITVHVSTTVPQAALRYGDFFAACDFGHKNVNEPDRPQASDLAFVPGGHGAAKVHASTFASGATLGPARAGVRLAVVHTIGCPYLARGTTNSAGNYTFSNLPPGTYALYVYPPAGSKVVPAQNPTPILVLGSSTSSIYISLASGTAPVPATPTTPTADCNTWVPPSDSANASGPTLANTGTRPAIALAIGLALLITGIALTTMGARRRAA